MVYTFVYPSLSSFPLDLKNEDLLTMHSSFTKLFLLVGCVWPLSIRLGLRSFAG